MNKPATQSERLIRIETLLETKLDVILDRLDKIEQHQTKQDTEAELDRADLAAIKNKGAGLLIGVGLAGGAIGATLTNIVEWFK